MHLLKSLCIIFCIKVTIICALSKQKVNCVIKHESLSSRARFILATNITFIIFECNLSEISGVTYDFIGWNLWNIFEFKVNNTQILGPNFSEITLKNGELQFLPNGFDRVFPHLNILNVSNCGLAILSEQNMKQFGEHLVVANFSNNMLTFLAEGLFRFNKFVQHYDFSNNPFLYVENYYVLEVFPAVSFNNNNIKDDFPFKNVACVVEKLKPPEENNGSYITVSKLRSSNCTDPEYLINYDDLEYHLKKEFEKTEIVCQWDHTCENNSTLKVKGASCNMTVINKRTLAVQQSDFLLNSEEKCGAALGESLIFFYDNKITYIPRNLVNVIKTNLNRLMIIKCELKSINQYDMQQFGESLKEIDFSSNKLKVIAKNTLKYNVNLENVNLQDNPLVYVDSSFSLTVNRLVKKLVFKKKFKDRVTLCGRE